MKSDSKFNRVIIEITCVLFALLFVYASISKLLDFERFQVQIAQSPILSVYAFWISRIVIAVELFAAGILLFARTKMLGLYTSIGLMGMFTAYIFIILFYSSFVPCSCGGILEKMTWESHLVFNVFFLVLGVTAVYLLNKMPEHKYRFGGKRPLFYSTVIILVSCFLVAGLFLSSEKIIHQQNPFIRRYEQSLVSPLREIDLKFNSYYFAGVVKDTVYLGNYTDPFHLLAVDLSGNKKTIQLEFEPKGIPFQAIRIIIRGKDVYLLDGTVPCVYRGSIGKWKMNKELKNVPRFTAAQPIDSVSIAFRNNTGKNKAHILGVFGQENDEKIRYAPQLLQQQIDGIFDTDGMLLYDQELKLMVYSYYYRNEFFTADTRAVLQSRGHTIDTISKAKIKVAYLKKGRERQMGAPPYLVNALAAAKGNLLFVNSKVPGKYESESMWKQSSIIDIYNLKNNHYVSSFSIIEDSNKRLKNLCIGAAHLYIIADDKLVIYKMGKSLIKQMNNGPGR